jgi:hypothetical protein
LRRDAQLQPTARAALEGQPGDSHFDHASLSVVESVGRVNRCFYVAKGCLVRMSWHFRAGADAKVAARVGARLQHIPESG